MLIDVSPPQLTGLLRIHHPVISCCHAKGQKDAPELQQMPTDRHALFSHGRASAFQSIEPLVSPRLNSDSGCLWICLSQMCLSLPPVRPSSGPKLRSPHQNIVWVLAQIGPSVSPRVTSSCALSVCVFVPVLR